MNPLAETKIAIARSVMDEYISKLPVEIQGALKNGSLKIVDSVIYDQKYLANDTTKELMEASDTTQAGITNVNNRKLEPLNYMVVTGIRLLSKTISPASAGNPTDAEIAAAALDTAAVGILNGELDIMVAGKTALPRTSCRIFGNTDSHEGKGYYQLESPFVIAPQAEIVPTLRVNAAVSSGNEVVRIELIGARIINA
jgi:hypothetical protein